MVNRCASAVQYNDLLLIVGSETHHGKIVSSKMEKNEYVPSVGSKLLLLQGWGSSSGCCNGITGSVKNMQN